MEVALIKRYAQGYEHACEPLSGAAEVSGKGVSLSLPYMIEATVPDLCLYQLIYLMIIQYNNSCIEC